MITPEFQTVGQLFGSVGWTDDIIDEAINTARQESTNQIHQAAVPNSRKRSHSALSQEPMLKIAPALAFDFDDEQAAVNHSNTVFQRFFGQISSDDELARSVRNFTTALNGHSVDHPTPSNQSNEPQTPSKSNQSNDGIASELSPLPNMPGVTDAPPTPDSAIVDPKSKQSNSLMVDDIEPIPRSIRDIYRQSNMNKKPSKESSHQSDDLTPTLDSSQSSEDPSSIHPNKKQKRRTTDEFFSDVGWSKDNGNSQSNNQSNQTPAQPQPNTNQSTKSRSNKNKANKQQSIQAFDYDSAIAVEDQSKLEEAKQNAESERVRKLMDRGANKAFKQQTRDPNQIKKSRVPKFLTSRQFTVKPGSK